MLWSSSLAKPVATPFCGGSRPPPSEQFCFAAAFRKAQYFAQGGSGGLPLLWGFSKFPVLRTELLCFALYDRDEL